MADQEKDHDLLISINAKLTALCAQIRDFKIDNKDDHDKIWEGVEKTKDSKLPAKVFYWLMPFVILGLISLGGLASSNRYSLGKIEKAIELHMEKKGDLEEDKNHTIEPEDFIQEKTKDAVTESIIIHK